MALIAVILKPSALRKGQPAMAWIAELVAVRNVQRRELDGDGLERFVRKGCAARQFMAMAMIGLRSGRH